ncbi:hypothetical protein GCM10023321_81090 [Pseudonocardia eucalypti]|uniref:Uncharacterized protein n=1 Tax=Pseudonocardia eucalypti TaxID=648755 RepID=A0ABP9RDZ1_9PSEU
MPARASQCPVNQTTASSAAAYNTMPSVEPLNADSGDASSVTPPAASAPWPPTGIRMEVDSPPPAAAMVSSVVGIPESMPLSAANQARGPVIVVCVGKSSQSSTANTAPATVATPNAASMGAGARPFSTTCSGPSGTAMAIPASTPSPYTTQAGTAPSSLRTGEASAIRAACAS